MTVYAAGYIFGRIVKVHSAQVTEPDNLLKLQEGVGKVIGTINLIACSKGVAGIYADSYAALILHHINYLRKVLESIAHIAALTGSILYHCSNSLCLLKRYVYGVCNYSQALIFAYHIQVAAGVKI